MLACRRRWRSLYLRTGFLERRRGLGCDSQQLDLALDEDPDSGKRHPKRQGLARQIQVCGQDGSAASLAEAKYLHSQAVGLGLDRDGVLAKNIIYMYLRCGSIAGAWQVFHNLQDRDVVLWTAMITAFAREGHLQQGLMLFKMMLLDGVAPNKITLLAALGTSDSLADGRRIHRVIVAESGLQWDVMVGTAIVRMYCRCQSVDEALDHFKKMPEKNAVSWSVAMASCKQLDRPELGLEIFRRMVLEGVPVDNIALVTLLDVCSSSDRIGSSLVIFTEDMLARFAGDLESNVIFGTALVNFFAKVGDLESAQEAFWRMKNKNVISWTALIDAHCCCGSHREALEIFRAMQLEGLRPNAVVFVNVLSACGADPEAAQQVLDLARECGAAESDQILGNAIVNTLGRSGQTSAAREIFERLRARSRDPVLWNGMLTAYAIQGDFPAAIELFSSMLLDGVAPNKATYASVLVNSRRSLKSAISSQRLLKLCAEESGLGDAIAGLSTLEFDDRDENDYHCHCRDVIWWSALIVESAEERRDRECMEHFARMQLFGVRPNEVTLASVLYVLDLDRARRLHDMIRESAIALDASIGAALINLYGRSELPGDAYKVFHEIARHSTASWSAMIACFAQNGRDAKTRRLYREMLLDGLRPDAKIFVTILAACSSSIAEVRSVHSCVIEAGFHSHSAVRTTLLSAYGKSGTFEDVSQIKDGEVGEGDDGLKSSSWWSCLIATAARHGRSTEAVAAFHRMQQSGARPSGVTMLCVLAACSHGGLAAKAEELFVSMEHDHGVERWVDHCSCMADLLGRTGRLDDAEELLRKMPFETSVTAWMTLLGACRTHGDVRRAKQASERASVIKPEHAQSYIVLSNVYAES